MAILLPVEIKHRELPSRLLIAAHALAAGKSVIIGNHWSLTQNLAAVPAGAILFKTCNRIQAHLMAQAKAAGHFVASTDEEVLVFNEPNGFNLAFAGEAAAVLDVFFAQGTDHRDALLANFPGLAVEVTGNVRVDLMRMRHAKPDPRVAGSKPYVLFNTNYGTVNSVWEDGGLLIAGIARDAGDDDQAKAEFMQTAAWERENHDAMLPLLGWAMQNLQGLRCVVRPHPGEKPGYWREVVGDHPSAMVVEDSDPHPWILGAELVVHTGCTTGLEAALMGRPVLNLLPRDRPRIGQVTNTVNAVARTPTEAAQAIVQFLAHRKGPIAVRRNLDRLFPGAPKGRAAQNIARRLSAVPESEWRGPFVDVPRTDLQKHKFTVQESEIREGLLTAAQTARVAVSGQVRQLGDSLFQISP